MGKGPDIWLAMVCLVCVTVLLVIHPNILSQSTVAAIYVGVGLRATGLLVHALNLRQLDKEKDTDDGH